MAELSALETINRQFGIGITSAPVPGQADLSREGETPVQADLLQDKTPVQAPPEPLVKKTASALDIINQQFGIGVSSLAAPEPQVAPGPQVVAPPTIEPTPGIEPPPTPAPAARPTGLPQTIAPTAPAPKATAERNIFGETGASIMRGVGGVMAMPRGFLGAFDIKTEPTESLAKSGKELAAAYPESPSVGGGISASNFVNPKWWASALPGLAVQILPIITASVGATLAAPELAIGGMGAGIIAGMAAGGVIGVSDAGQRMLDYEEQTGKQLNTLSKITIGLGAGTAGALLPGMAVTRMVGGKAVSAGAEQALLKVFGNETVAKVIAERAIIAAHSGGSMAGFSVIENAFEKYGYHPDKELTQGVFESLVLGTMIGGLQGEIARFKQGRAEGRYLNDFLKDTQQAYDDAQQVVIKQYGGGAGTVIGEPPAEVKPVLDQFGRPAGPDEIQAALAKQPWDRNAQEKFLADQAQKETRKEILPPVPAVPGEANIIPGTTFRPRADIGEATVERLQRSVDIVGNTEAGKQLSDLLIGNQNTIANAFRAPGETRGIPEITDRIIDLARKVEDTGDSAAAKELNDFINSNLGALKGLPRWPVGGTVIEPPETPRITPGPMGVSGGETQQAATAALGIRRTPPAPRTPAPKAKVKLPTEMTPEELAALTDDQITAMAAALDAAGVDPTSYSLKETPTPMTVAGAEAEKAAKPLTHVERIKTLRQEALSKVPGAAVVPKGTLSAEIGIQPEPKPFTEYIQAAVPGARVITPPAAAPIPEVGPGETPPPVNIHEVRAPAEVAPQVPYGENLGLTTEGLPPGIDPAWGFQPASGEPGSLDKVNNYPKNLVKVKPDIFQHKRGVNLEQGGAANLQGTTPAKWDESKTKPLTMWGQNNGDMTVANGHTRNWYAQNDSRVNGVPIQIYWEKDGWTAPKVAIQAALENMSETGNLDALDVGNFLRKSGLTIEDLKNAGVPLSKANVNQGLGLSGLTDRIWDDVYQGKWGHYGDDLAAQKGAALGAMLRDNPAAQEAIYKRLMELQGEGKEYSVAAIRNMAEAGRLAVVTREAQGGLFGDTEVDVARVVERGVLTTSLTRELGTAKNILIATNKHQERLEAAGNKIEPKENKRIAAEAKAILDGFGKYKNIGGSETDRTLNEYAEKLAQARSKGEENDVKQEVLAAIHSALQADARTFGVGGKNLGEAVGVGIRKEAPGRGPVPGTLPEGETPNLYVIKKDGTLGLFTGDRPLTKFEKRLNGIISAYPAADPERLAQALRAAPKSSDRELAGLAAMKPGEASRVVRDTMTALERAELAKRSGMPGAALFPEIGMKGGGLFGQAPEPTRVPLALPAGARPAVVKKPGINEEIANAQEAGKGGAANVAAGEPQNRPGGLSENAQGNGRALAHFQSRGGQEAHGDRQELEIRAGLEPASEAFVNSPEAQAIRDMVVPHEGIRNEVVFVKDSPFYDAALIPEADGTHTLVVSATVSRGTAEQQARHEVSHAKEKTGDPATVHLVESVDMTSDAAMAYRDALNRLRAEAGFPPLSDKGMTSEIAADLEAGMTRKDADGKLIDLNQAVRAAKAEAQAAVETALPEPMEKVKLGYPKEIFAAPDEFAHLRPETPEEGGKVGGRTLKPQTLFSGKEGEEHVLGLLKARMEVFRGKLKEGEYNAQYADKYGKWGSREFKDNIEFLKYSLKEPLPETEKDYAMYSEKTRQGWVAPGEPKPSFKEFQTELAKDDNALERRLRDPANKLIPLYEGETYLGSRGGDFIKDAKGKKVQLDAEAIYKRLYDPQKPTLPLGTETTKPEDLLGIPEEPGPEGTVEKPPGFAGGIVRSIREKFAAASISEKSRLTHQSIVEHLGWAAREVKKDAAILDKYLERFGKMTRGDLIKFTDAAETGRLDQVAPDLQKAAQTWRLIANGLHFLLADAKGGESAYWENYFPRLFKDPERAATAIAQLIKSRGTSLTGPESMNKARTQLLFSDSIKPKLEVKLGENGGFDVVGVDGKTVDSFADKALAEQMVKEEGGLGLEPRYPNYVDMMKANIYETVRFLTGKYIEADLKESGFIQEVKRKTAKGDVQVAKAMSGWEDLGRLGDKTLDGYYAHPDVARVMENFLSKGLRGDPLFEIYNSPASFMNTVMVAMSAFHATFSTFSDLAHGIGSNLSRAIGAAVTGRYGLSGHYLAEMAKAGNIPANVIRGGKLGEEYITPGTHPEMTAIVDMMTKAGIRFESPGFKETLNAIFKPGGTSQTELGQMSKSFAEVATQQIGVPRKVIETIAWPIMSYLVPRLKINATARLLQMELDTLTRSGKMKDMTPQDITRLAQEVARKSDNIFGQMVYDNLSMKRGLRDGLRTLVGFPGWNIGSFTDILQAGKGLYHIGKETGRALKDIAIGRKPTWETMSRSNRMSLDFYMGTVMVMAVFGAFTQRLLTGKWPGNSKDLMMPQTGKLMANGQPERLRAPTYMRDVLSLNHPFEMVKHKLNWPLRMMMNLVSNQDFFGTQIRDPYAGAKKQAGQVVKFVGKSLLPFGIQGYMATEAPKARALNLLGITKVPRVYSNSDAMNVIDEYNRQNRATMTSREAEARKNLKVDLRKLARAQDEDGFREAVRAAMEGGKLTRQQIKTVVDESQAPPGLGRFIALPVEWQVRAWAKATEQEKALWQPYFLKKMQTAKPEILIRNRDILAPVLREMGLDYTADTIQNLKISDKAATFKLTGLGIRKPTGEMADIDTVDLAMAKQIAAQEAKLGTEPKARKYNKPSKYSVLGIQ